MIASILMALAAAPAPAPPAVRPPALAEDVEDVDIMFLAGIDYRPGKPLPKSVRRLDGKRVRIEAYMSLDTGEGESQFLLTFDGCGCGVSNPHHYVEVTLTDDTTTYTPGKVVVEGVLAVGEEEDDLGIVTSVYRLEAETYEEV